MEYKNFYPFYNYYNPQWTYQYVSNLLLNEITEDSMEYRGVQQRNEVSEILQIFLTRRVDVLNLIESYGVPRLISRAITRRIIKFVLENEYNIPGNFREKTRKLFRRFIKEDRVIVFSLRMFGVPEDIIYEYIRKVIRVTLRNIDYPYYPNIDREVNRVLKEFERTYPNYLGLTTRYNINRGIARNIVRDIIEFTLLNITRIPQVGPIDKRAKEMLKLLDREAPKLIERMINRGVPPVRAEAITKEIIRFTFLNIALPR
ncbi:MAG: hypothetical protein FH753_14340 [Firmicutes bacterium]|nr:hypothetical protein [Bacillota bacterium]